VHNSDRRFDESVLVLEWGCGLKWNEREEMFIFFASCSHLAAAEMEYN
jgi:hypothetical protein